MMLTDTNAVTDLIGMTVDSPNQSSTSFMGAPSRIRQGVVVKVEHVIQEL